MSNQFLVNKKPNPWLGAAVFAAGAVSPMELIEDIEKDLRRKKVIGMVVFDLLLAHGNKINRYFVANFDGKHFARERFQSAGDKYEELSLLSAAFLKNHVAEVDASLLSNAMQHALKKGIPF